MCPKKMKLEMDMCFQKNLIEDCLWTLVCKLCTLNMFGKILTTQCLIESVFFKFTI